MAILRELVTVFDFKVDKAGLEAGVRAGEGARNKMATATRSAAKFTAQLGLVAQGFGAMRDFAKRAFDLIIGGFAKTADETAKTARSLGINIERLQELQFAAQISGASANDVSKALKTLAKRARGASQGLKAPKAAFEAVGVSVTDAEGKLRSLDEILKDIAQGTKRLKNPTEKAALAQELIGKSGVNLINFLNEGRSGINRLAKDFQGLGAAITEKAANKAEAFNDEMLRTKLAMQGIRNTLAAQLLPALTSGLRRFANWISVGDRVERILRAVRFAAKTAGLVISSIVTKKIIALLFSFGSAVAAQVGALRAMGAAALLARARMALLLTGPLLLLLAVAQDLFKLFKGEKSVIAEALGQEGAKELKESFIAIGKVLKDAFKALAPVLAEVLKAIAPLIPILAKVIVILAKIAAFAIKFLIGAFRAVGKAIVKVFKFLAKLWNGVIKVMAKAIGGLAKGFRKFVNFVRTVFDTLKSIWTSVVGAMGKALKPVRTAIATLIKPFRVIVKAVKAAWNGLVDFIKNAIDRVLKLSIKIVKPIGKLFGVDIGEELGVNPVTGKVSGFKGAAAAGTGGQTVATTNTINMTVNAPEGVNAEQVGNIAAQRAGEVIDERVRTAARNLRAQ